MAHLSLDKCMINSHTFLTVLSSGTNGLHEPVTQSWKTEKESRSNSQNGIKSMRNQPKDCPHVTFYS